MKKSIIPILLIAGGAAILFSMRKRRATVTAEMPVKQTAEEFEAEYQATVKPTLLDKATDVVKNIFSTPPQRAAAKRAQAVAVKRAVSKGISKKKAKAVTKTLSTFSFPKIGGTEVMF